MSASAHGFSFIAPRIVHLVWVGAGVLLDLPSKGL